MASGAELIRGAKALFTLLKFNNPAVGTRTGHLRSWLLKTRTAGNEGSLGNRGAFGLSRRQLTFGRKLNVNSFIVKNPATLTYLLLPFPLKIILTSASCEDIGCANSGVRSGDSLVDENCKCTECFPPSLPRPPCPPAVKPSTSSNIEPKKASGSCCEAKNDSAVHWCEPQQLSHQVLVRQATQLTVDSVTRVIGEVVAAYQDYHDEYRGRMDNMMDALESVRSAHGIQAEVLDCQLIMYRAKVEDMKKSIVELETFMVSVQKLADAAAETAYLSSAEYHSVCMCDRMQSALNEMKMIREESLRKERDMIELQSLIIVESGKSLK